MGLHIVEQGSRFAPDNGSGIVMLESDITDHFPNAIEELQSTEAKNLAVQFASQRGVADPRLNGMSPGVYPINAEGVSLDQVAGEDGQALHPAHPRMQVARYRADISITRKLI